MIMRMTHMNVCAAAISLLATSGPALASTQAAIMTSQAAATAPYNALSIRYTRPTGQECVDWAKNYCKKHPPIVWRNKYDDGAWQCVEDNYFHCYVGGYDMR